MSLVLPTFPCENIFYSLVNEQTCIKRLLPGSQHYANENNQTDLKNEKSRNNPNTFHLLKVKK